MRHVGVAEAPDNASDDEEAHGNNVDESENESEDEDVNDDDDDGEGNRRRASRALSTRDALTINEYYMYILARRSPLGILHMSGRLCQKFVVDAWVKIEGRTLDWIERNQPKLRVDSYSGLLEYIRNRAEQANARPGRTVILPSSFTVS